jgi:hypothetical protein
MMAAAARQPLAGRPALRQLAPDRQVASGRAASVAAGAMLRIAGGALDCRAIPLGRTISDSAPRAGGWFALEQGRQCNSSGTVSAA